MDADTGRREARGRRFQDASYDVLYAGDGFEGDRLARRWQPDVVLVHVGDSGSGAFAFARHVATNPRTRGAQVVLTSEGGVVGSFRVHETGALRYLMLTTCRDQELRQLVGCAEGGP
jgi:DNA-binding response OmpR family regulator